MDLPCTGCGSPSGDNPNCHLCEMDALWETLPASVRAEIDEQIIANQSGMAPRPSIKAGLELLGHRVDVLTEQGRFVPTRAHRRGD